LGEGATPPLFASIVESDRDPLSGGAPGNADEVLASPVNVTHPLSQPLLNPSLTPSFRVVFTSSSSVPSQLKTAEMGVKRERKKKKRKRMTEAGDE
jgi:hypothetical protein